jgi:CP12 domain
MHRSSVDAKADRSACPNSTCLQTDAQIKEAIKQAEQACEDAENKGGCANAWDDVEELSAAAAHGSQVCPALSQLKRTK